MMCYRDMTFCSQDSCARFLECERAYTDKVKKEAQKWWGGEDFPICIFTDKPECYTEEEDAKD